MKYRFFEEPWMTSLDASVYHLSSPERDAWCGRRFTKNSFIGIAGVATRRCKRCTELKNRSTKDPR